MLANDPRHNILEQLRAYVPASALGNSDWEKDCQQSIIHFVEKHPTCFERSHTSGHLTGSAWVINPARTHVALIFHPKLSLWLQPGGHSDGDPDTQSVARREAQEELGVPLEAVKPLSDAIFHVDCHLYPARMKNGKMEEMHIHHDVRYLFELDDATPFSQNEGEAVTEKKWLALADLAESTRPDMATIATMARKTIEMFA